MFQSIVELQPRSAGGDGGMSVQVRDTLEASRCTCACYLAFSCTHTLAICGRIGRSRLWMTSWTAYLTNLTCTRFAEEAECYVGRKRQGINV